MKIIFFVILCSSLAYATPQSLYDVILKYKDGEIFEKSLSIMEGYPSRDTLNSKDEHRAEVKSFEGKILHTYHFEFSFIIYTDPPTILDETGIEFFLPYFNNAETIEIYYKDELVDEINVAMYSDIKILEKHDKELAQFVKEDIKPEWQKPKWLILAGILIIGVIIIILIKKRNKN